MANNNPIGNIISDVLGIGAKPLATFQDKIAALNVIASSRQKLVEELQQPDLSKKLTLSKPLVIFDLETTGTKINKDQIFQAGFYKISPDGTVQELKLDIKPDVPIEEKAAKITGVTQKRINTFTQKFGDVAQQIKSFLEGADLGGYNVLEFDIPLLQKEFERAGLSSQFLGEAKVVDVLKIARARYQGQIEKFPTGMNLSNVFEVTLGKKLQSAHEAGVDIKATKEVLEKFIQTTTVPTEVGALARLSEMAPPSVSGPIESIMDVFRADKFSFLNKGFRSIEGEQIDSLFQKLYSEGSLPHEAGSFFRQLKQKNATIYFNENTKALFFGKDLETIKAGGSLTPIPVGVDTKPGMGKMVQFGTSTRAAQSVALVSPDTSVSFRGFLDFFYETIDAKKGQNFYDLTQSVRRTLDTKITNLGYLGSLLGGNFTSRGIDTSATESMFLADKYVLGFTGPDAELTPVLKSLRNFKTAESAFAMLIGTGGRSIFGELGLPRGASFEDALNLINKYKKSYLGEPATATSKAVTGELANFLKDIGTLSGLPYIKPERSLGDKKLITGSMLMSKMFGTMFEEHSIVKGLYQLSKLAPTTGPQIRAMGKAGENFYAPYLLKDSVVDASGKIDETKALELARRGPGKLMKVAIVEPENQAISMSYFGESGGFYTEAGERALKMVAPKGTIKITGVTPKDIERAERLFGFNMAEGNLQYPQSVRPKFTAEDVNRALTKDISTKELSDIQKDIRKFVRHNRKYAGFMGQLGKSADPQAALAKVNLTEGSLVLDFTTAESMTPTSVESVVSARRATLLKLTEQNMLSQIVKRLEKQGIRGTQVLMAADEYSKMFGQQLLISNFIGVVNEQKAELASSIFEEVFKTKAPIATSGPNKYAVAIIANADDAMKSILAQLDQWKGAAQDSREYKMYNQIVKGSEVTEDMADLGVKSVRTMYMFAGARTDFMSDINMLKPVKMTLSKMISLGSAGAQLGYKSGEDPLFKFFANLSEPWRQGHLKLSSQYGQLVLGEGHWLKKLAKSLVTPEDLGNLRATETLEIAEDGKFLFTNKKGEKIKLKDLPKDMSRFKYKEGGVALKDLEGTILDTNLLKSDIMYIDLGKEVEMNLLDIEGSPTPKKIRYVPVPLKGLRLQGRQGALTLSEKMSREYQFIEGLIEMQKRVAAGNVEMAGFDPNQPLRYLSILKGLTGREGIFNKASDIVIPFGTRVRLAPSVVPLTGATGSLADDAVRARLMEGLMDPEKLFEQKVLKSEVKDLISRKRVYEAPGKQSRTNKALEAMRQIIEKPDSSDRFILGALGIDPTQRAEHMNVVKLRIIEDSTKEGAELLAKRRIGQLNLFINPFLAKAVERDFDKDVANLIFLEGTDPAVKQQLEDRLKRQVKLAKYFQTFTIMQAVQDTTKSAGRRLMDMIEGNKFFAKVEELIGQYRGTPKSLGYTITRSSESIMANLIDKGVEGARELGLLERGFTEDAISKAITPYMGEEGAERLSVVKKLMQNVYQGAVQKGTEKGGLIKLAEDLLVKVGQKFKGNAYNLEDAKKAATEAFTEFLMPDMPKIEEDLFSVDLTRKNRAFMAMDYILEKEIVPGLTKESIDALKADLAKENYKLTEANKKEFSKKFAGVLKNLNMGQAKLLGEFFGAAMPFASSIKRSYKGAVGIIQQLIRRDTKGEEVVKTVLGGALGKPLDIPTGEIPESESVLGEIQEQLDTTKKAAQEAGEAGAKKFLGKGGGKFALGLGVGAVAAATIMGMAGGPEPAEPPPMPRPIDGRQPTDVGPDVIYNSPRVYGSSQIFAAPRRGPGAEPFSAPPRYNYRAGNDMRVTVRDKRSTMNPYLIEQQMRSVANSDFTY